MRRALLIGVVLTVLFVLGDRSGSGVRRLAHCPELAQLAY